MKHRGIIFGKILVCGRCVFGSPFVVLNRNLSLTRKRVIVGWALVIKVVKLADCVIVLFIASWFLFAEFGFCAYVFLVIQQQI
jgi:hypothetical protein